MKNIIRAHAVHTCTKPLAVAALILAQPVVDYDWHVRLLAQNCSFFPNNAKNYARF